jgi:hypothetical protein
MKNIALSPVPAAVFATFKKKRRPLTCNDVENITGRPHQSASAAIRRLVILGFLKDSGKFGKTDLGHNAIKWTIA